jgi:hypothetical protein
MSLQHPASLNIDDQRFYLAALIRVWFLKEQMNLVKRLPELRQLSATFVPEEGKRETRNERPDVRRAAVTMRQEFEDAGATVALSAWLRVQSTDKQSALRGAPLRAIRVDARIERWETAKE